MSDELYEYKDKNYKFGLKLQKVQMFCQKVLLVVSFCIYFNL